MRFIPAALQDHLDSGATTLCRCWKLTRRDGAVMGFTDHDRPLGFDGVAFEPGTGFEASSLESATGLAPDTTDVIGALSSGAITEADLERGRYDDAEIDLFLVNWQDPAQRILLFRGNLGETTRGPQSFRAELRGMAHRLDQPQGRAFTRRCDAELGDARCGVSLTPILGTVTEVGSDGSLLADALAGAADGAFAHGLLSWTGGANAGTQAVLREHSGLRLMLWTPPPDPVQPGDAFSLTPGCDKRFETCRTRFANAPNFRGFPHMPGEDWLLSYPKRGEANDGAALG